MKNFSGMPSDMPLCCGRFPPSPLIEKVGAAPEIKDDFIQVGEAKTRSSSINPKTPVLY
jgi:hypothetical protein